jgi:hypothetical protein
MSVLSALYRSSSDRVALLAIDVNLRHSGRTSRWYGYGSRMTVCVKVVFWIT